MCPPKNNEHLFVYGTLRKDADRPMSDILQRYTKSAAQGTFTGKLFDVGSYPAAILTENASDQVHGELYKLTDAETLFHHLDPYEGFDAEKPSQSLYLRKKVTITMEKIEISAWTYIYNRPVKHLTPIPDGDYLTYLRDASQQ